MLDSQIMWDDAVLAVLPIEIYVIRGLSFTLCSGARLPHLFLDCLALPLAQRRNLQKLLNLRQLSRI